MCWLGMFVLGREWTFPIYRSNARIFVFPGIPKNAQQEPERTGDSSPNLVEPDLCVELPQNDAADKQKKPESLDPAYWPVSDLEEPPVVPVYPSPEFAHIAHLTSLH